MPDNLFFTQTAWRVLPTYDFASEFVSMDPNRRVLILKSYQGPSEKLAAKTAFADDVMKRLRDRGLTDEQLVLIGAGTACSDVDKFEAVAEWLTKTRMSQCYFPQVVSEVAS